MRIIIPIGKRLRSAKRAILDMVSAAAVACYSLRTLRAFYTGPLVRLRRASDNAESDFFATIHGIVDVVAVAAWAGGDSFVVTWYDQSGNGIDVTQATAAKQPAFDAEPSIKSTSTTRLETADNTVIATQPLEIIAVASLDDAAIARYICDSRDTANRVALLCSGLTGKAVSYSGGALPSGPTDRSDSVPYIHGGMVDVDGQSKIEIWEDGVKSNTGSTGGNDLTGLVVGNRDPSIDRGWVGDLFELVIFDADIDADRATLVADQKTHFGIA